MNKLSQPTHPRPIKKGATYTPEYYINMRTGTHYFPRGVASAGGPNAIDKNRQKFGLNKIDETSSIGANIVDNGMSNGNYYHHRRTESMSCEPVRRILGVPPPNMDAIMCNTNLCSATPSPGLSPDVQRRLALATYKAMECKAAIYFFIILLIVQIK